MIDKNIYALAGIPGCGKTTWAKAMFPSLTIVSSDEIRKALFGGLRVAHDPEVREANNRLVFFHYHESIRSRLQHGRSVVADATNLNHKSRAKLREIAEAEGGQLHLVLFKNLQEAVDRNRARDVDAIVPEEAMERMVGNYWDTLARIPQEKYASVTKIESVL